MSEQRLSKLQKWILENCFMVTLLLDRTALKKPNNITSYRCRNCPKTNENVRISRDINGFITYQCVHVDGGYYCSYFDFFKEDILLSYFLLPPNNTISHINRVQHFHESPDYAKAHVTAHRSIINLCEKGLINTFSVFREDSIKIYLTDSGIKKAAELLKISDYTPLIGS